MNSTFKNLATALEGARIEPVCDWVQKYVPVIGSKHGVPKYKVDEYAEYVRAPLMDCMPDSPITNVNFVAGIGAGKSELISAITQRNIKMSRNMLLVNFTENMLRKYLDSRLMPAIKRNEDIKHLIPANGRKRILKDRIVLDNMTLYTGSMTLSQLQAVSVDCVLMDEVWLAGDDAAKLMRYAKGRGHDRAAFKFVNVSQASLAFSPWHNHARQAEEWLFGTTCDGCGKHFGYGLEVIKYDRILGPDELLDLDATSSTARLACPHCEHEHADTHATRSRLSARGSYKKISDGRTKERTYYAPAFCFRGTTWQTLILQYLEAQEEFDTTDKSGLLEVFETQRQVKFHVPPNADIKMGENPESPYGMDDIKPDNWEKFLEDKGEFACNLMGVDCQKGHYYVTVRAHFRDGTRILLHRSQPENDDDGNGGSLIKIADDYKVQNHHVGIDGGYKMKDSCKLALAFRRREGYGGIVKVMGARIPSLPIVTRGHTGKHDQTWMINVTRSTKNPIRRKFPHTDFMGVDAGGGKTVLELKFQNLHFKDQVRALMNEADLFQIPTAEEMEEYVKHMTREIRKPKNGGYIYERPYNSARVDFFDCEVITALLARIHQIPDPLGGGQLE